MRPDAGQLVVVCVEAGDLVSSVQQPFDQMRADEAARSQTQNLKRPNS